MLSPPGGAEAHTSRLSEYFCVNSVAPVPSRKSIVTSIVAGSNVSVLKVFVPVLKSHCGFAG